MPHLIVLGQTIMHLLPNRMLRLQLRNDAGNRASDVRFAQRAVDGAVAANALFAGDAEGT